MEVFNSAKRAGDDDGMAIAKAISTARRMSKYSEKQITVTSLATFEVSDAELETKEFEVLRVGEFYDSRYGVFKITEEKLLALKRNFDDKVLGIEVALDVNHDPEHRAFAWLKSLEVKGSSLYAKFKDFSEEGKKYFLDKMYKYFSVEFGPFERAEGGKKTTIKDVLRGIALTNRPVIKNMQPTFLSEEVEPHNSKPSMNVQAIKLFAEDLLSREKITKDDTRALRSMIAVLSEDEKAEVASTADEVEEKAKESEAAPAEKPEESKEPEAASAAELSEANKKLAEQAKEIESLKASEKARIVKERVEALTLSETNKTGFSKELSEKVTGFVSSLSDELFTQFSELIKGVVSIPEAMLAEKGHGMMPEKKEDMDKMMGEVAKLAAQYEKDGMKKHLAVEKAQKEVFGKK